MAILLGGIVTTMLFQVITGQGRFVGMQSAREEVQQNTRAAVELIGSELRTLPAGETLVRADADSLTVRTVRIWGVVCGTVSGNSFDVVMPAVAGASYTPNTGTGAVVNVGTAAAPVWTNAVAVTGIGNADTSCGGAPLPAGAERRTVTLASLPQNGGTNPAAGNAVYLYEQVTYRTGVSSGIPGRWIQRRVGDGGTSTNQPMAGPIDETTGLRFQYFAGSSTTPIPTPIVDAATRRSVTRVQVSVASVSRGEFGGEPVAKSDTVVLTLRNRL